jgi:hypothetical protein
MKWRVYGTQTEAIAAERIIAQSMGLPRAGVDADTGAERPEAATIAWAIPREINDGRWVIPSPDEQGVESEPGWWPEEVTP